MGTKIQWTDESWNPVAGCTKVSAGCENCYALAMARRQQGMGTKGYEGLVNAKGWTGKVVCLPERLAQPLHWRKPRMVFVCSMADLLHEAVPPSFIGRVRDRMEASSRHTFQILTKRPDRLWRLEDDEGEIPENVWVGTTVEDTRVLKRIPQLKEVAANVAFLSCEPLLGPLDNLPLHGIDWVIVGGETGPGARVCEVDWIRSIVDQCGAAGVAVFVKQLGALSDHLYAPVGRKNDDPGDWPEDLRVRAHPEVVRAGV